MTCNRLLRSKHIFFHFGAFRELHCILVPHNLHKSQNRSETAEFCWEMGSEHFFSNVAFTTHSEFDRKLRHVTFAQNNILLQRKQRNEPQSLTDVTRQFLKLKPSRISRKQQRFYDFESTETETFKDASCFESQLPLCTLSFNIYMHTYIPCRQITKIQTPSKILSKIWFAKFLILDR